MTSSHARWWVATTLVAFALLVLLAPGLSTAQVCMPPGPAIFADGVEPGDFCRWSVPPDGQVELCSFGICGDGLLQSWTGEECDDGNVVDESTCPYGVTSCHCCSSTCKNLDLSGPYCGDGHQDFSLGENCDDGNQVTETQCPYGTPTCGYCSADCGTPLSLAGHYCGDGDLDPGYEDCDDGNNVTELCPYGVASCQVCSASCQLVSATGPYCGDGNEDVCSGEVCDDHNSNACGTCDGACGTVRQPTAATGQIVAMPGGQFGSGETFAVGDGFTASVIFEFNPAPGSPHTAIIVTAADSAAFVANKIRNAIASSALNITAQSTGALVTLTNNVASALGNVPIVDTVANGEFVVSGMSGGKASDCLTGTGCVSDADCASGSCSAGHCQ